MTMIRKHAHSCIVAGALLAIPATAMAQTTPTTGRAETQATPAKVIKTETASFQFWTLNCNQFDDANKTRNCVARLPVIRGDNQALIVVLSVTGPTQKDL
ncbi:hypothetical protein BL470_005567, partial [Escherichia coli]|nr:hypothetical protein [Escherichia coli]